MRSTRQDILSSLKKLKGEVAREYSVKKIGVFGSVARSEETEHSDIDLLVEFSKPVGLSPSCGSKIFSPSVWENGLTW